MDTRDMDTLDVSLELLAQKESDKFRVIKANLVLNGEPVLAENAASVSLVVDVLGLLVRGATNSKLADFDPVTCTCGVAGCAGFHDPVSITTTDTSVIWNLPSKGGLALMLSPAGQSSLTFDKQKYVETLLRTEALINQMEAEAGLPVVFSEPQWWDEDAEAEPRDIPSFSERIKSYREWFEAQKEEREWEAKVFGEYLLMDFTATKNRAQMWVPFNWVVETYAKDIHEGMGRRQAIELVMTSLDGKFAPIAKWAAGEGALKLMDLAYLEECDGQDLDWTLVPRPDIY